jgi:hypothetical protein
MTGRRIVVLTNLIVVKFLMEFLFMNLMKGWIP